MHYIIEINFLICNLKNHTSKEYSIFRCANQVSIDDEVLVNESGILVNSRVIDVTSIIMEGNYQY